MNEKEKGMKTKWILTGIAAAVFALLGSCATQATPPKTPNISLIKDGSYEGSAKKFPVSVRVRTEVAGGRIVSIEILKHFNGKGEAAERITDEVIAKQSVEVDAISGATHSSGVILKAIEASLSSAAHKK